MRIALDIGGTSLRIGAAEGGHAWSHSHRADWSGAIRPEEAMDILAARLDGWGIGRPEAIGVSVAAVVGPDGVLVASENLGWRDLPLRGLLEARFACPVIVETDVYCGALFEARTGEARGVGSALYMAVGTGIGHAFILGGRVWVGAGRGANALGHMVIDPGGAECYCGHRGCLCMRASGRAQATSPGAEPLDALAHAIGNAVTLVEPERVILSGGALNQPWFDIGALAAAIPAFSYPAAKQPQIVRSTVADPNLCGAVLMTKELS